jgi:molybdopterin-guanine dinucleotide biosynthesis protein A
VLGIVLAGGASSRMGAPKATLEVEGEPLVKRVVRAAAAIASHIVVVAEPALALPRGCFDGLGAVVVRVDDPADARFGGPLRALAMLFERAEPVVARSRVVLLGVDHPAVDARVTAALARGWRERVTHAAQAGAAPPCAVVPREEERGPQPLLAMYETQALVAAVRARNAQGDGRLRGILEALPRVDWLAIEAIGPPHLAWSCNTPAELAHVLAAAAAHRAASERAREA